MKAFWYNDERKNLIGLRIRELRKEKGITIQKLTILAQLAGHESITANAICKLEGGSRFVPDYEVAIFAELLGTTPNELLNFVPDKSREVKSHTVPVKQELQQEEKRKSELTEGTLDCGHKMFVDCIDEIERLIDDISDDPSLNSDELTKISQLCSSISKAFEELMPKVKLTNEVISLSKEIDRDITEGMKSLSSYLTKMERNAVDVGIVSARNIEAQLKCAAAILKRIMER